MHIKNFSGYLNESEDFFQTNEETKNSLNEAVGVALLAGFAGTFLVSGAYDWAREFWSKNVVGSKYKETGKTMKVVTKLPNSLHSGVVLNKEQKESGEVVTELREYKDRFGNLLYGYDHLWSPDKFVDKSQYIQKAKLYTALYTADDLPALKKYLENSERYASQDKKIAAPAPIEMIYKK